MATYPIAVPDRETQRRVADFLDDQCTRIDTVIRRSQQQMDALEEHRGSHLEEHMLGSGPEHRLKSLLARRPSTAPTPPPIMRTRLGRVSFAPPT